MPGPSLPVVCGRVNVVRAVWVDTTPQPDLRFRPKHIWVRLRIPEREANEKVCRPRRICFRQWKITDIDTHLTRMRCDLVLPTLFVQEVQVGLWEDCRAHRGTHLGNTPWVEFSLGAVKMLPLGEGNVGIGLRDQFVITMSLDLTEEDIT